MFITVFFFVVFFFTPEVLFPFYFKSASSVSSFSCSVIVFASRSLPVNRQNKPGLAAAPHSDIQVFAVFWFSTWFCSCWFPLTEEHFLLGSVVSSFSSHASKTIPAVTSACSDPMDSVPVLPARARPPRGMWDLPSTLGGGASSQSSCSHILKNKTKQNPEPLINSLM